jgi:hypothetical protein
MPQEDIYYSGDGRLYTRDHRLNFDEVARRLKFWMINDPLTERGKAAIRVLIVALEREHEHNNLFFEGN